LTVTKLVESGLLTKRIASYSAFVDVAIIGITSSIGTDSAAIVAESTSSETSSTDTFSSINELLQAVNTTNNTKGIILFIIHSN
jgi:hypothetical protein